MASFAPARRTSPAWPFRPAPTARAVVMSWCRGRGTADGCRKPSRPPRWPAWPGNPGRAVSRRRQSGPGSLSCRGPQDWCGQRPPPAGRRRGERGAAGTATVQASPLLPFPSGRPSERKGLGAGATGVWSNGLTGEIRRIPAALFIVSRPIVPSAAPRRKARDEARPGIPAGGPGPPARPRALSGGGCRGHGLPVPRAARSRPITRRATSESSRLWWRA